MDMLTLSHVSKSFGSNHVLQDLNVSVPKGSIFGFVGQNGAGKTTAMKLILGLLQPDRGEIFVNENKVSFGANRTSQYIGYLPDVPEFYGFMTPREYLSLCGEIAGLSGKQIQKRVGSLLDLVGLNQADKRIHGFSRGMKQRLGIAQALLGNPLLLICDEPTSALDPMGRKEILNILASVKGQITVIFSTHILSDVERICDQIAFLHKGNIALRGSLEEIRNTRRHTGLEVEFAVPQDADVFERKCPGSTRVNSLTLSYEGKNRQHLNGMIEILMQNQLEFVRIQRMEPALEDLFMEVISK